MISTLIILAIIGAIIYYAYTFLVWAWPVIKVILMVGAAVFVVLMAIVIVSDDPPDPEQEKRQGNNNGNTGQDVPNAPPVYTCTACHSGQLLLHRAPDGTPYWRCSQCGYMCTDDGGAPLPSEPYSGPT